LRRIHRHAFRIPFLGELFHEIQHPRRIAELGLAPRLDAATETLGRVNTELFFNRLTLPSLGAGSDAEADVATAIVCFYEPFLETFDPELRKQLGVWYTPPEVVRYQVRRADALLRNELSRPLGFADPDVVVLDPCCGTGAYRQSSLMPIEPSRPAKTIRNFSAAVHRLRLPFWPMATPSQVPNYWTCERPSPNLPAVPFRVKHYTS
jgi:hypothetical protein